MSFVTTQPAAPAVAATPQGIGPAPNAHNAAVAVLTTGAVPAAADEAPAQFAAHAQMYRIASAQAVTIHEMFVKTLGVSAALFAAPEAANAVASRQGSN
ncbi:PE family protein [Mycobacterium kansasii]|uniref:PE-PGRS family protein PE_PGRS16 n=1 Tax=Mycobacterium attenuatum TaxID=2341086 RepID=A0A498Q3F2_9MYCO|nr:PE family protein [Mycobacterium attenuatum]ORB82543.1 PE family protein [Mycobacterium kansasii]VBA39082.1 PE-PGRS family protein PE_PGRS16 [Mycobacterium attenuatum]VBA53320.1 PE-PGRS family protein PE_PGRS16 [Mycobacterium attenuatum]VBA58191.1 PE-PGRS family protein PE_PGRS16 [Mycobacterium attenuatum]